MKESILYRTDAWLLCAILFVLMLLMFYLGLRLRKKHRSESGLGSVEASLFGLLGLLLAFTFGMSGSRFDARRSTVVEEANNIGTAVLRADMYDDSSRQAFKKDFAAYIEARIAYYDAGRNEAAVKASKDVSDHYAGLLWARATTLSKLGSVYQLASMQMIPALNAMFDVTTAREAASKARVPDSIVSLLFLLSLVCSFFAGFAVPADKKPDAATIAGFALLTVMVIYVILDLDRPRRGIINLDVNQQYMKDLRKMVQ